MENRSRLEAAVAGRLLPNARIWRRLADRALAGLGMSTATGWALVHVRRLGGDVRQTDLAAELEITNASLVRLLDQLAAAGLIVRRTDADDARVKRIALTGDAAPLVDKIEERLGDLRAQLLREVSDDGLAITIDVLERLGRAASMLEERT